MWWFFFFKQKSAYEMRIGDCSSDVCSSDLTIIYRGGPIVTMDGDSPQTVEAVVTKDGRIAYVGDEAGARAAAGADAAIHDLHGATMLPGFVDAHSHFSAMMQMAGGLDLDDPSLPPVTDIPSLQELGRAHV